ncbi:DUF6279 family lipoprotein [Microbulbifer sp. SAOS-129_SWC]|uniref:DUF6279 family lipoprotein n=1 Tax=Microbulbifer sp. SAOS-129_SWC TaxID=3145235 RepID=UPI003217C215
MTIRPLQCLLLLALLLAGCSSVQFAYNQLDRWMRWQLDDYVDLDSAQQRQLKGALDSFHRWHRQTQLPRYAEFLRTLATRVESGQALDMRTLETRVTAFADTASAQLLDLTLPLAAQLRPQQIDELAQHLQEKRRESLEEWRDSPDKVRRRRGKKIRKQSERWLGSLTDEQEALITGWVEQMANNPVQRDRQRQLWQARVLELLRHKPAGYLDKLRSLLLRPEQLWDDNYRGRQQQRRARARALGQRLYTTTTADQRRHLVATLREYADDFDELSRQ